MADFSQLLAARSQTITDQWIDAVIRDKSIETADHLSRVAIKDHVSQVLAALVTVLSLEQDSDVEAIAKASFEHGAVRAEQGFDPGEIAREYHLLRATILQNLRASLLQGTPEEILRAVSLIDFVVDAAISECFKSYVSQRLRELDELQTQLKLTNQELKRLVRANKDNVSLLAHELKTPLTSIIGYSELFLREQRQMELREQKQMESREQKQMESLDQKSEVWQQKQMEGRDTVPRLDHIERVLRSGRRLLHMINDVLEISRYEAGRMLPHLSVVDVHAIVNTVIEVTQPLADSRGLHLIVDCDLAPEQVITDSLRLQQILMNLVSNAIRYTEKGSVTLSVHALNEQEWTIVVSDTGIGIAPDDQSKIFAPFSRAEAIDPSQFPDSTGLGLAIVARLVQLLHGKVHLTSEVNVGSTFTVVLPIKTAIPEEPILSVS